MEIRFRTLVAVGFLMAPAWAGRAEPQAPPPAWAVTTNAHPAADRPVLAGASQLWSVGEPTDDEQYYLELLNRARLDPVGEAKALAATTDPFILNAYSFFGVDLGQFLSAFQSIPSAPPLAFEPRLIGTAREHSQWMLANGVQSHNEGAVTPSDRLTASGYPFTAGGENIFAYAESVYSGFAGFEVDWGSGAGTAFGMQVPPGHRDNDHDGTVREIGVGVVYGSNQVGANAAVGPQLVTFDFATRRGVAGLVTGVAYYDLNTNGMYDPGEGLGGATVEVSSSSYYAVTSASGAYAAPCPDGPATVTFTGTGLRQTMATTIAGGANVKVDLQLPYSPPTVTGPSLANLNAPNTYSTTPTPGADAYRWRTLVLTSAGAALGAEQGLTGISTQTSAGYSVVSSDVAASGGHSYHLAMPASPPTDQSFTLTTTFVAGQGAQLSFFKELGFSATAQHARAQFSTDGGKTWTDVWQEAGFANPNNGVDTAFTRVTAALPLAPGTAFQVRFLYSIDSSGGWIAGSAPLGPRAVVGVYFDAITVTQAQAVGQVSTNVTSTAELSFTPPQAGVYGLAVAPVAGSRTLPEGPALIVGTTNGPAPVVLGPTAISAAGAGVRVRVRLLSGAAASLPVESSASIHGPFAPAGAALPDGAGNFALTLPIASHAAFFRVRTP